MYFVYFIMLRSEEKVVNTRRLQTHVCPIVNMMMGQVNALLTRLLSHSLVAF